MAMPMELKDVPTDTIVSPSAQVHIAAPASHVFKVLLDTSSWPEWNSFCPQVDVTPASSSSNSEGLDVGAIMNLHVRMTPSSGLRQQKVSVTELRRSQAEESNALDDASGMPCYTVSWQVEGMPQWLLRGFRTSEVKGSEDGEESEFRTWEFQAGPLARVVKLIYGTTLQERFQDWADDLKAFSEKTWQQRK